MQARRYTVLLLAGLVLAGAIIWWLQATTPLRLPISVTQNPAVRGLWGDDGEAAWSRGDARIPIDIHAWVPWRRVTVTLQQPPGAALQTQLRLAGLQLPVQVAAAPRQYQLLMHGTAIAELAIASETVTVAGDRRALGVRVGPVTVARLTQPFPVLLSTLAGWLLPLLAAAVWMWRRGVVGLLAWLALAALCLTLLAQELARGYPTPTLLLVSPWRELLSAAMLVAGLWPRRERAPATSGGRRIGLDLLRAVAVSCVVVAHALPLLYAEWSTQPAVFRWFVTAGDVGVDIFFALSGFLIGAILLRQLPLLHTWQAVRRFWMRRWLRTLPAAYVSALVVWLIAAPRDVGSYLRSILFVGTIDPRWLPSEMGFWWSLGAEEAFYVIAPLTIWWLVQRLPALRAFVVAVGGIAAVSVVLRLALVWVLPPDVAGNVSYAIYARLDSMMWGVGLALLRVQRPAWYTWLAERGAAVGLLIGACGIMLLLDGPRWLVLSIAVGHVATTVGATALIPALERWQTLGGRWQDAAIRGVALVSYSVYLYHSMWEQRVHAWYGSATDASSLVRNVVVFVVGTALLGTASYWWVERPVLRWRDRFYADPERTETPAR